MINSHEISNEEIRRFFEQKIVKSKGEIFFQISTGSFNDHKLYPVNSVALEFTGEKKFLEILDKAFGEDPYYIGISLFDKAVKNVSKKAFYFKKFTLKKVVQNNSDLGGLGSLESLGGLEGIMRAKIKSESLAEKNEDLKKQIEKLQNKNEKLSSKNEDLKEKVFDLNETVKKKDWDLRMLKDEHQRQLNNSISDHQRELDGIEQRSNKFEKVLAVAGLVVAKASGLNETDLKGIIGGETFKLEENKETSQNENSDTKVDFEQVEEFEGKKAEAKEMIDNINNFLTETLKANNEQDAFKIIASYTNIINFTRTDFNKLKLVHDYVLSYKDEKISSADKVLQQAENYNNNK